MVVVLGRGVVLLRQRGEALERSLRRVALLADPVTRHPQLEPVRVVAVRAADPDLVHLALHEGADDVDLLQHLAVSVVQRRAQRLDRVVVVVVARDVGLRGQRAAPRVAGRAALDLGRGLAATQLVDEARLAGLGVPVGAGGRGSCHVLRARAVAGLARDVQLVPGRVVGVGRRVVVLGEVRRVAIGAHQVPVLVAPGPVELVVRRDALVGVEREPALLVGVPRDGQALQPPPGELDQVLLQGLDAERVRDGVVAQLAFGALGVHPVLLAAAEEPGRHPRVREARVVEVPEHAGVIGVLHREVVVRAGPALRLEGVAARAGRAVDVDGLGVRRRGRRHVAATGGHQERGEETDGSAQRRWREAWAADRSVTWRRGACQAPSARTARVP